jgi:hypothetical protein
MKLGLVFLIAKGLIMRKLVLLLFLGFGGTTLIAQDSKLLVISEDTPWKNSLVEALEDAKPSGWVLEVLGPEGIKGRSEDSYDRLLLVSGVYIWKLQGDMDHFLFWAKDKSRIIVVATNGHGEKEDFGVDTITSSSIDGDNGRGGTVELGRVEEVAAEIYRLLGS